MLDEIARNSAAVARILDLNHLENPKAAAISLGAAEISAIATAEHVRHQAEKATHISLRI